MFERVRKLLNRRESAGGDEDRTVPAGSETATDGGVTQERPISRDRLSAYPAGTEVVVDDLQSQLTTTATGGAEEETVTAVARTAAGAGVTAEEYARVYELAAEAAVEQAFERVEKGESVETARTAAVHGVRETIRDLSVGLGEFERTRGVAVDELVKAFPMSAILIGADHSVIAYTGRLMGLDDDHSEFLGEDCRETIAVATYSDRSRANTLADKVAENPRDAHEHWDVDRTDEENSLVDFPVYRDTSVSKNNQGVETHIEFVAVPIFDDRGELTAVFELIEDATEDVRREQEMVTLIEEVSSTLEAIGDGDLSARAEWEDESGLVETHLQGLTGDINAMADSFEDLIRGVDRKTRDLEASISQLNDAAGRIDGKVDEQNDSLDQIAREIENVSATMEEVAANASEVTEAAQRARETTEDGVQAGEKARETTEAVQESTAALVDTVEELGEQMDEISEVVEIIADIAEQTNMLALNANIEAARADQGGAGFAVVADEVKSLATETQEYADKIAARVEEIQAQADDTIDGVERSHEHVEETREEIERVLDSLDSIAREVTDATTGISEVADANDDQAARIEEVTATVEQVQQRAHDVADTTDEVVDAAQNQETVATDLAEYVDELS